jgi:hypothetical protein
VTVLLLLPLKVVSFALAYSQLAFYSSFLMSLLSNFARGGAVAAGTNPTDHSSPGSHLGARDSLLPTLGSLGTLGERGERGGEEEEAQPPLSLTAGGAQANSMSTPRQLDNFMQDEEADQDVTSGDWHNIEESIGLMGGEFNKEGVVRVVMVVKGPGKDVCCGAIGTNSARFCTSHPLECTYKSHLDKKADVKPGHVYLGSEAGNKSAGWVSWSVHINTFGGRHDQLPALGITGSQFRRFGETLLGIQMSGGHVNMASYSWDSILKEIIQPLDYAATPHKVQFKRTLEEGAIQSTGLSN